MKRYVKKALSQFQHKSPSKPHHFPDVALQPPNDTMPTVNKLIPPLPPQLAAAAANRSFNQSATPALTLPSVPGRLVRSRELLSSKTLAPSLVQNYAVPGAGSSHDAAQQWQPLGCISSLNFKQIQI